ncbi:MAG: hypothetical protein NVSMB14_04740 [Isosphaeraceae bacterium]
MPFDRKEASTIGMIGTMVLIFLIMTAVPAKAGDRRGSRGQSGPHRSQSRYIHDGLPPGSLPYTRQGLWGWGLHYPGYPLFRAPVPNGPGDCLYETGLLPTRRG